MEYGSETKMEIHYHLDQMSLLNQSKCVGDLIRYYGESKYMLKDQIDKIKGSSMISNKIIGTMERMCIPLEDISANLKTFFKAYLLKSPFKSEGINLVKWKKPLSVYVEQFMKS